MADAFVPSAQQCSLAPGQVGRWHSCAATVLVVRQGRAWVTVDGGPYARSPRGGDWFLDAGMELVVAPRRRLLVEPAGPGPVVVGIRRTDGRGIAWVATAEAEGARAGRWAARLAGVFRGWAARSPEVSCQTPSRSV